MKKELLFKSSPLSEDGTFLVAERYGDIVAISMKVRIKAEYIETGKKLLDEIFMIDPEIHDDKYVIKGNHFIYTIYAPIENLNDQDLFLNILDNHFHEILEGINLSDSDDLKLLSYIVLNKMYIRDYEYLLKRGLIIYE